ncbi:MAG: sorbosone dehydrogenase family protein, partial [Chloroflexia bacterium]|nr:sorbosone dehydrogenase family protein [Chloroflexia bacterium]
DYTAHSSPLDMRLYDGDQFPEEYVGSAFVTFRGSWNRSEPSGYEIARLLFDEQGQPTGFEAFASGWLLEDGTSQFGRIVGLAQLADGSLLVSTDTAGIIYRISYGG